MQTSNSRKPRVLYAVAAFMISFAANTQAQTESVIYGFSGGMDGALPAGSVISDSAGNLCGTTVEGGGCSKDNSGCGTAFEVSPSSSGGWTESVLYRFTGGADGYNPQGSLVMDAAGSLLRNHLPGRELQREHDPGLRRGV